CARGAYYSPGAWFAYW
nr:immunoglobulin heavy chain junction region [Mus musculus]